MVISLTVFIKLGIIIINNICGILVKSLIMDSVSNDLKCTGSDLIESG